MGGGANPVKRFLQTRNVGMCMCHHRLLGLHIVHSTKPTVFLWRQFVVPSHARIERTVEHLSKNLIYPDPKHYINLVQKFFFRGERNFEE